jgi:hypothetical protein
VAQRQFPCATLWTAVSRRIIVPGVRRFAICLSLLVTACGGVVIRQDGSGGTTSTANRDRGLKKIGPATGGASAIGSGAGGFGAVTVTTYSGGATSGGVPYTGGRVGVAGFVGIGGAAVDAGGPGFTGGVGGVGGLVGVSGASGFGGVAGGSEYACLTRIAIDPVCTAPRAPTAPIPCTTTAVTSDAAGLEGRCIPSCLARALPLHPYFDAGHPACPSDSVCAPCYEPIDATPTGACSMQLPGGGSDQPTMPAPLPYASCPDGDAGVAPFAGGGVCMPEAMVNFLSNPNNLLYDPLIPDLKQDSCAMGEKCVPKRKAGDPRFCASPCTTSMALVGIGYSRGACVPTFAVYDVNGEAGVSIFSNHQGEPDECGPDELCYSCSNPLRAGMPTGACY